MVSINFIPYPMLLGISLVAVLCLLFRKRGWGYITGVGIIGLYSLALADAMFFPFGVPHGWPSSIRWEENLRVLNNSLNLIPFNFQRLISHFLLGQVSGWLVFWQTAGNMIITIPFGIGLGWLTRVRGWRVVISALLVGLVLEGLQLIFILLGVGNQHLVDVNDTIFNSVGVLIGYGLSLLARDVVKRFGTIALSDSNR